MTTDVADILATCRRAGIRLQPRGDRLHVDAPPGVLTAELRDVLIRHKPALLAALSDRPRAFITLPPDHRTGFRPTLPVEAIELALDLERRGFHQGIGRDGQYEVMPGARLTPEDRAAIARWRAHMGTIVGYVPPSVA